eukprot:scaffold4242_cov20-Tisochrysis_lutea.AAC.3
MSNVAVDAVFDSVSIATTFREDLAKHGVIFCSISEAVHTYPEIVKKHMGSVLGASRGLKPGQSSGAPSARLCGIARLWTSSGDCDEGHQLSSGDCGEGHQLGSAAHMCAAESGKEEEKEERWAPSGICGVVVSIHPSIHPTSAGLVPQAPEAVECITNMNSDPCFFAEGLVGCQLVCMRPQQEPCAGAACMAPSKQQRALIGIRG